MASGTIRSEEGREKPRWNENSKVYTRRFRNKKNATSINQSPATASIAGEASTTTATNNNENGTADKDDATQNVISNANTGANDINNAAQFQEAEDANSNQQQPNSPITEVVSGDTLSLNRQEEAFLNDHDENAVKESTLVRPVITRIDNDKIRISFSAASLKHEKRELKRKLVSELEEVKQLAKKLKYMEAQLSRYNDELATGNGFLTGSNGQMYSQYTTSNAMGNESSLRVFFDVNSVGFYDSRPFQHLPVSVMDNRNHVVEILDREKRTPKANQYYTSSEFICGTDKIPSVESNKKKKTHGSKKRGGASAIDKKIFKKCGTLLTKLMKHQFGWVFNTPVDVKTLGLHDYYDVIKYPMDLGTVKTRLSKNWYKSPLGFAEDVRLTFHNAMTYNPEGQDVHIMAVELLNVFEESWVQIEADYSSKLRYEPAYNMGLPVMPAIPVPSPPVYQEIRHLDLDRSESFVLPVESRQKPPIVRTQSLRKPKARDLDKRDMTFEEKKKLSSNLENLPSDKLFSVVQIIKKRNSALSQNDDEVEVDINSVDAETLWELDRFVTNYKKSLSKQKRKAEIARQRAEAQQGIQVMNLVPSNAEVPKDTKADDTNTISGSSPVLGRKEADNISSTSSSSSSDSGSSSSVIAPLGLNQMEASYWRLDRYTGGTKSVENQLDLFIVKAKQPHSANTDQQQEVKCSNMFTVKEKQNQVSVSLSSRGYLRGKERQVSNDVGFNIGTFNNIWDSVQSLQASISKQSSSIPA
ncbi:hypothetical protein V2J09_007319 [Rumex salicifolius]